MRFFTALLLLLIAFATSPVMANDIVVVNVKVIVDESEAAKSIADQVEKKRDEYQEEVDEQEEALRKQDQELAQQRSLLSKEAFEQQVKEFRAKVLDAQREVQERRSKLENAYVEALAEIKKHTLEIIEDLAKKRKFSIALPKSQLLYSTDSLDISDDVLSELNRRLPDVDINIED